MSVESSTPNAAERPLPAGTVTFVFTDIEGSTKLLQQLGADWPRLLADHDRLLEGAIGEHGGKVFGHEGDAIFAAFGDALSAVGAVLAAQRAVRAHEWRHGGPLKVRMGVHTGEPIVTGSGYVGLPLHQVARIAASAHGGQVLVSAACQGLVADRLEPGVELRDLGEFRLKDLARSERLYELVAADLPPHPQPPRTTSVRPNNLPLQLTSFVGRAEIEAARGLLPDTRLLTLTGPGGTGKTRLALQLAGEVLDEFPDGTFFVELDAVDDPDLVPSMIAHTLGLDLGAEPPIDRLIRDLKDKRTLLVLDNFEQVVGATPAVARLLREAPELKIIVTSRIVLRANGEQEFSVPPLSQDEGVRLFAERAAAASSTFKVDDTNRDAVRDVVTRLDTLPLAIELAAARVRILPLEAIRARLDQRLAMLTGGARDLPARQQTLRGAIDWSYDLLEEPDRRLFERLAVFAGGGGLTQIEVICGPASDLGREVLDGLGSLVDKSLLRSVPGLGLDPRFAMLATIREYAADRLARRDPDTLTRRRHAETFLSIAESCAPLLTGPDAAGLLDQLELEHDNLRSAIDWSVGAGDANLAHGFAVALWRFWQVRGHLHEAVDRVARILAMPKTTALSDALHARTLGAAGSIAYWSANQPETSRYYRLALEAARASGDKALIAEATYNAGFEPTDTGGRRQRYAAGREPFAEALRLYRELDDEVGIANATWALGIATLASNDPTARGYFEQSVDLYRAAANRFGEGWAHHMLGIVDIFEGHGEAADARFRAAQAIFSESGDRSASVLLLLDFALVWRLRGDLDRFWRLAAASHALALKTGIGLGNSLQDFVEIEVPSRPVGDPVGQRGWDAGLLLTADEAMVLALGEGGPAGA